MFTRLRSYWENALTHASFEVYDFENKIPGCKLSIFALAGWMVIRDIAAIMFCKLRGHRWECIFVSAEHGYELIECMRCGDSREHYM